MKKIFKYIGFALLGIFVLILCAAAYVQWTPAPVYPVNPPKITVLRDSAHLAEGRRIATTICAFCHRGEDGKLSGKIFADDPAFGKLWSANLTQHPTAGIAAYSDAELAYTLRTGIKRDGHFAGAFMLFPGLSDEDLASVIAFLRSDAPEVQASEHRQPPAEIGLIGKLVLHQFMKPLPYPEKAVVAAPPADTVAYGRYLATGKWACFSCHSASFETNNELHPEKSEGFFAGGNPIQEPGTPIVPSANLTPDKATGIGNWTKAQFAEAVRFGRRPDGSGLQPLMPPFTHLTDTEIDALWAYLKTVPPVNHPVERYKAQ